MTDKAPTTPLLKFFEFEHLKNEELKVISAKFYELAHQMEALLPGSAEKTTMFRKLLEAKDCAVRAAL